MVQETQILGRFKILEALIATAKLYRRAGELMILESVSSYVEVEINDDVKFEVDSNLWEIKF